VALGHARGARGREHLAPADPVRECLVEGDNLARTLTRDRGGRSRGAERAPGPSEEVHRR
ncbi:MAG: hypothetical protein ACPIOQ_37930, partial [Promethearchaeia archaeon]